MKVLVILCSHKFDVIDSENITILNKYLSDIPDTQIEYCGISNQDDFYIFEKIIPFKFKIINSNFQLSKVCDFITDHKHDLDYDWFIKVRPDVKLLESLKFEDMMDDAINARARVYYGPKQIKYGMSINGEGAWKHIGDRGYCDYEREVILDDMLFIFNKKIVQLGAFEKIETNGVTYQNEWTQTQLFKCRNISLNVIGIHLLFTKGDTACSGDTYL